MNALCVDQTERGSLVGLTGEDCLRFILEAYQAGTLPQVMSLKREEIESYVLKQNR